MKVELKENKLVITITSDPIGRPSASGKTTVHASTNGNQPTTIEVGGKVLIVGLNAYTSRR